MALAFGKWGFITALHLHSSGQQTEAMGWSPWKKKFKIGFELRPVVLYVLLFQIQEDA